VLALGLAGCGGESTSGGPTLVMAEVKDATILDPSHATDGISLNLTAEVLENLVRFKAGTFDIEPALATRWHTSADKRTWKFTLRRGVRFSDGTPFDARAVTFNVNRWRLKNDPARGNYNYVYYASQFGGYPGVIQDVRADGDDRVVFRLTHPVGPFLRNLAMPSFGIGSPAAIRADTNAFEQRPVGTGPYTVAEWMHDDHITLSRNASWYGPVPAYKTVVVRDIPDQATSVLSMQKGDVDMLEQPRPDDAKALAARSGIGIVEQPSNNLAYLAMNFEKKPFADVRVRRAIAYAVDIGAIVQALYGPGTVAAGGWLPPGMLGDDPALHPYARDPVRARALLRDAGFPHGFATSLSYPTAPRPYMPEPQRLAETLQADLRDIGITVTLQPFEFGVFLQKVQNGEHEMCLIGWSGDNGDPDNFLYPLLDADSAFKPNAQNYSFWRDPQFHRLMIAGQTETDDAKRRPIYREAARMVHDLVPALALVHTAVPVGLRSSVAGFVPSPDTEYHFELMKPRR